ncbi:hypothetical protein RCRIOS_3 [Rhodobacter phage RcRios]|nr:hypothetical protein RCRIOS_3 [Rhodobacter phage RcRios]
MALEDEIKALTAALKENTAALNASMQVRAEALTIAKATVASAAETKAAAAEKPADKPKEEAKPAPEATDAYAGLKELIAGYLGVERPEERKARQEKVIALLNHEKIKKPGLPADAKPDTTNIAPESIELFKKQMSLLKEKGDLTTPASDALV